ncbi:hypothetical protein ACFQ0M_01965 [Kitasatospora aburaviensis]
MAAEVPRVAADDLGEQRLLADRAAARVLGADRGPVVDGAVAGVLALLVQEVDDLAQRGVVGAGGGEGVGPVDGEAEVGEAREAFVVVAVDQPGRVGEVGAALAEISCARRRGAGWWG